MNPFGGKPNKKRKSKSSVHTKSKPKTMPNPKKKPEPWKPPIPPRPPQTPLTHVLPSPKSHEAEDSKTRFEIEPQKASPKLLTARKDFLKTFSKLTVRWRPWDIWTDFVTLAACTISNAVDKIHYDEREELYLRTIKKYNEEERLLFPELFAHVVRALEENPEQDFLGDIYTELGLNSKEHQQIFTPYHVCRLMAEVTIGDIAKEVEEKGFVTIHDCCCGAGAILIAASNVAKHKLEKVGLDFQDHLLVTGQDIDYVVTMMCYIQLSLLGVAGYFKVGNALTEPMSDGDSLDHYWFTPMYYFPVWRLRRIWRDVDKLTEGT